MKTQSTIKPQLNVMVKSQMIAQQSIGDPLQYYPSSALSGWAYADNTPYEMNPTDPSYRQGYANAVQSGRCVKVLVDVCVDEGTANWLFNKYITDFASSGEWTGVTAPDYGEEAIAGYHTEGGGEPLWYVIGFRCDEVVCIILAIDDDGTNADTDAASWATAMASEICDDVIEEIENELSSIFPSLMNFMILGMFMLIIAKMVRTA